MLAKHEVTGPIGCVTGYNRTEKMQPREKHDSEVWKAEITECILQNTEYWN